MNFPARQHLQTKGPSEQGPQFREHLPRVYPYCVSKSPHHLVTQLIRVDQSTVHRAA